jgi:hypothetical protein
MVLAEFVSCVVNVCELPWLLVDSLLAGLHDES